MRKAAIAFSIFIFSQTLYSQTWFDVGLKGGYGPDFLVNNNFYNDHNFSPKFSFGYLFGGKVGINFNETHALTIDVTSSSFNQSFNYLDSSKTEYSRSIGFNALNFVLLYRKTTNASYFEIGPQYSMITKTRFSDSYTQTQNTDVSENLVKSYYSAVMGFGGYLAGTQNFRVTLGLRFSYALNDIISSTGKQMDFPSITKYNSYKTSNPFTAMLLIEMDFDLGYFATSKCKKKKTRFLLF